MWISARPHSRRRGSALLTVLWLSAALAAVGIAVASTVRSETERTATNVDDTKAYFLARGAIERAALHMFWSRLYFDDLGRPLYYRAGFPSMDLSFPGGEAHVEIIPETAKLNLNSIRPEDLMHLLEALDLPPDQAAQLTGAILDWRSPPDQLRASPFDSFYLAQQPSFLARHASFLENEELLLLKGMTPDIYYGTSLAGEPNGLRDCLSVYGSTGPVEINTARPATLRTVGLTPQDVDALVKLRADHPVIDPEEFLKIAQALGPAANNLALGGRSMYTLRATARMRTPDGKLSDLRRTTAALVKMNYPGNREKRQPGFEVVRWYDRP